MAATVDPGDERSWDAEKRDFVADHRDEIAAVRDAAAAAREELADERERGADARDQVADQREHDLEEREVRIHDAGHSEGPTNDLQRRRQAVAARAGGAADRADAAKFRATVAAQRGSAEGDRISADAARAANVPATGLALAFARIAAYLYDGGDVDAVLGRVAEAAVATMAGCSMASVTVRDDAEHARTAAATDPRARDADFAQYNQGEGPCLDATEQPAVYAPAFPDSRWPSLADDLHEYGVEAVGSYRIGTSQDRAGSRSGMSLNTYASEADAYTEEAREIGLILAAHASVAVDSVRDRQSLEDLGANLRRALESRDVISQAKGILMERLRLTPDDAFDVLRRASQTLHIKLREVAEHLAETGELITPSAELVQDSSSPWSAKPDGAI